MSSPLDHKQPFSLPPLDGNHDPSYDYQFTSTDGSSSYSCPRILFNPSSHQLGGSYDRDHHQQSEAGEQLQLDGSSDRYPPLFSQAINDTCIISSTTSQELVSKPCAGEVDHDLKSGSVKWMSSKMRLMRKMMNSDRTVTSKPRKNTQVFQFQDQQQSIGDSNTSSNSSNSSNGNGTIRVCSDCNTTKTPLWRSGPQGPKSLCNACGIRQRKARRALAAAAAGNGLIPTHTPTKVRKEKRMDSECTLPYKKRCRITSTQPHKKLCFDDFTISLSKNSAFHQVFPQDEKEAAILLMALSCGLICG